MTERNTTSSQEARNKPWHRGWLDLPALIGIIAILTFAYWFVRHYAAAIS